MNPPAVPPIDLLLRVRERVIVVDADGTVQVIPAAGLSAAERAALLADKSAVMAMPLRKRVTL